MASATRRKSAKTRFCGTEKKIEKGILAEAIKKYNIDPNKENPLKV